MRFPQALTCTLLVLTLSLCCLGEVIANWECGFEVDVPDTWLRRDMKEAGLKLSSDEVRMQVEPFSGISYDGQVQRLHKETKAEGYQFKTERSYTLNQVPAHEMIFFKDGNYKIYYVLMAGQRGFLWTVLSESTDSEAFLEGQDIISSFLVTPL